MKRKTDANGTRTADTRIAWLWPGNRFRDLVELSYWGPLLKGFQEAFPKTVFVTTGEVHPDCDRMFRVISVGESRWKKFRCKKKGFYETGMGFLPLTVVSQLFKLRPDVIVTTEFSIWTLLSVMFRHLGRLKVVVLYEGYAPSHGFEDAPLRFFLRRWVAGRADAFVTNSRRGKDYLKNTLGASGEKIFRIVHEVSAIAEAEYRSGDAPPISGGKRPRFLYVGKLIHRKGVDLLLKSWGRFKDMRPESGSLWIVGGREKKEELIRRAEDLGLKDVHFVGEVKTTDVGPWYGACDVFVFPTREDTWGVVLLEAMSAGKAVLCSKNAGSSELV